MRCFSAIFLGLFLAAWTHGTPDVIIFSAPGVPCPGSAAYFTLETGQVIRCNFVTGRTSSNDLKKLISPVTSGAPFTGISSSSVSIGTGSKSFVINGAQPFIVSATAPFEVGGLAKFESTANTENYLQGTVTAWNGTTLTINVPSGANACGTGIPCAGGSGTHSDWQIILNAPNGTVSYDPAIGLRVGSTTADITISDWDWRGSTLNFNIQNTKNVLINQFIGDFCNQSSTLMTGAYIGVRSGTATFSVTNSTIDGCGVTPGYVVLGNNLQQLTGNYFDNLPSDAWLPNDLTDYGNACERSNNFIRGVATGFGTHADGFQLTDRVVCSPGTNIHHNVLILPTIPPPGSGGETALINFGCASSSVAWTSPVNINNVLLYGGSYPIGAGQGPGNPCTGVMTWGANVYAGGGQFFLVYPGTFRSITAATKANPGKLTIPGHGWATNQPIIVSGVVGMTQLNGNTYTITVVDSNNVTIGIDTTSFGTYTSGGSAQTPNWMPNSTVMGIKSVTTGLPQSFPYNLTTVTSIP